MLALIMQRIVAADSNAVVTKLTDSVLIVRLSLDALPVSLVAKLATLNLDELYFEPKTRDLYIRFS